MNCKPGDLAIVVRGEYAGMILMVLGPSPHYEGQWLTDLFVPRIMWPGDTMSCEDSWLCPIRDNDGTDETLTWSPRDVTA